MRFVTFIHAGEQHTGLVTGDEIVDLQAYDAALPANLAAFLALGADVWTRVASKALASAAPRVPLADVRLCAPVAAPDKVFGIGMNFSSFLDAARRRGMVTAPGQRIWFNRQPRCVAGPSDDIWMRDIKRALDPMNLLNPGKLFDSI
ncbi:UNVERIFIED_ORG: FAD/FMN-containing dehydrogenase [Paraburkholderia sediminicola]|nr:FAD/FMN-containing dehydrogenase [Paraburkholderia sediminicola]